MLHPRVRLGRDEMRKPSPPPGGVVDRGRRVTSAAFVNQDWLATSPVRHAKRRHHARGPLNEVNPCMNHGTSSIACQPAKIFMSVSNPPERFGFQINRY